MDSDLESYLQDRERALDRVRRMLIEDLHVPRDPDEIDPDAPLFGTGLGLDSIDAVELVVSLESALGVKLPEGALGRRSLRTVNMLVDIAVAHGAGYVARG
jgi:acyl carrier protein